MKKKIASLAVLLTVFVAFTGFVRFSVSQASQNTWDSKLVLNEFYIRSRSGKYQQAYSLLSNRLRSKLSLQTFQHEWKAFEQAHGSIKNWVPSAGGTISGGSASILPKHVDFNHKVTGTKKSAGKVSVRLTPESGTWQIDQLNIQP